MSKNSTVNLGPREYCFKKMKSVNLVVQHTNDPNAVISKFLLKI